MSEDLKRSGFERRSGQDRRCGVDTRSEEERRINGERRSNKDRRLKGGPRANSTTPFSAKTGDGPQLTIPTGDAGTNGSVDDRRTSIESRRKSPRTRILKGAKIFWPSGAAVIWPNGSAVKCLVRNLSQSGAKIEAHNPVPETFEIVFDVDHSRRSCRVVWRKGQMIGVKFL